MCGNGDAKRKHDQVSVKTTIRVEDQDEGEKELLDRVRAFGVEPVGDDVPTQPDEVFAKGGQQAEGSRTDEPTSTSTPDLSEAQKLSSLGVFSPDEVDRICGEQQHAQFLVEDFLPLKSVAIAGGESTIGKSPLMYQLGLCAAAGIPFLGLRTTEARVLYLDLENSITDGKEMRDSLVKLVELGGAPSQFLVCTEPPKDLEPLIAQVNPQLVIIDSLRAFSPETAKSNTVAGQCLKELRRLARKYGCTFLIIHHLRKPSKEYPTPDIEDCTVATWLAEMEGARALVNQTDVRIAIAEGDGDRAALKLKWSRRVHGDMPIVQLERVFDDDEPLGYRQLTGIDFLSLERRTAFEKLPNEFSTGQTQNALGRGDQATHNFLEECKRLGLIKKLRRGCWKKLTQGQSNVKEAGESGETG